MIFQQYGFVFLGINKRIKVLLPVPRFCRVVSTYEVIEATNRFTNERFTAEISIDKKTFLDLVVPNQVMYLLENLLQLPLKHHQWMYIAKQCFWCFLFFNTQFFTNCLSSYVTCCLSLQISPFP